MTFLFFWGRISISSILQISSLLFFLILWFDGDWVFGKLSVFVLGRMLLTFKVA